MTERLIEAILGLEGTIIYVLVVIFTWAEAAFFLGAVTPGELAIVAGGVLASRGQAMVVWVGLAACVGTFAGNSTGYWLGRLWGDRIAAWWPIDRFFGTYIEKTRAFVLKRGQWAIVGSRINSYLRISLPFIAGASGMGYRRFLVYDIPAGAVWALIWVGIGFWLGESWRALLTTAGPAAFLVLILFVAGVVIGWAAIRVARRQAWIVEGVRRFVTARSTVWVIRRARPPLRWIRRRLTPGVAGGLQVTFGFMALVIGGAVAGLVLGQTRAVAGLVLFDFPVLEWMIQTRTDEAVRVARTVLRFFHLPGVVVPTIFIFLAGWVRGGWKAGLRAAVGLAGAGCGAYLLDRHLLQGVVPGAEFPSVPVAIMGAMLVHAVALAGQGMEWGRGVATAAIGLFLTLTVALGTIVAGTASVSGIVLGFALGMAWAASLELPSRLPSEVDEEGELEVAGRPA